MAFLQLRETEQADSELKQGRVMGEGRFHQKLELCDNKTGKIQGWIMAPIFLREAEKLAKNPSQVSR